MRSPRSLVRWIVIGCLTSAALAAQPTFLTEELRVDVENGSRQRAPRIVGLEQGRSLVVWQEDLHGVMGRVLERDGSAVGGELALAPNERPGLGYFRGSTQVNKHAAALALPDGRVLVAWTRETQQISSFPFFLSRRSQGSQVLARLFFADGTPAGSPVRLSLGRGGSHAAPELALLTDGRVLAAWSFKDGNGGGGLRGRLIEASGRPTGDELMLGTADSVPGGLGLVVHPTGVVLMTWHACCDAGGDEGVFARLLDPQDTSRGTAFRVNDVEEHFQIAPSAAVLASGELLVVWQSSTGIPDPIYHRQRVHGQKIAVDGTLLGGEVELSDGPQWGHVWPALSVEPGGDVLLSWIAWSGDFPDAVTVRELDPDAVPKAPSFFVSTGSVVGDPTLATLDDERTLVAWIGYSGEQRSVSARLLGRESDD